MKCWLFSCMFNRLSWQRVSGLMSSRECVNFLPLWLPAGRYPQGAPGSQKVWEAREGPQESRDRERCWEDPDLIVKGGNEKHA